MLETISLRSAKAFPSTFEGMKISLASPETIRSWSHGEVTKAETINYRSYKPEPDGLFCERIFGPVKDWECSCGRYKRIRYRGVRCDRCGVEVTHSRVRRERMGNIELAVPVTHIWYYKTRKISKLLDVTNLKLERVIYYESYIVMESEHPSLREGTVLTDEEVAEARETYGDTFKAGMGAEAILQLLEEIDLDELAATLRTSIANETTVARRQKNIKRLKEVEAFRLSKSDNSPDWMVLKVLPVLPPDLRPLVPLEGGRFASSDLNDLYRRVINRNNRLKRLLDLQAPQVILRNEKRMLQEAVDAVLDNSSRRKPVKGAGMRPLRSLSDLLKGKRGRFRQNLLGKRVDYSGRSVIVVGPELKFYQCGLPKMMALELFKPFVVARLADKTGEGIKLAAKKVDEKDPSVWEVLESVIRNHPVLLNRAPTLHRLGIQAFEPVLVEGLAIRLHPLACAAFNADFDGDQMAVHVPLSAEAQIESRILMLADRNILKPASGDPVATPSHDMVIGPYALTKPVPGAKGEGMIFSSIGEVLGAYGMSKVSMHAKIKIKGINQIMELNKKGEPRKHAYWKDYTTVGQVLFNEIIPDELGYVKADATVSHEATFGKGGLKRLVAKCYDRLGPVRAAVFLDNVKDLGFHYATRIGLTVGMDDMVVPPKKIEIISKAKRALSEIEESARRGELTEAERYNRVIDIWGKATDDVKNAMMEVLSHQKHGFNPIYMMANSGARGSVDQVKQLAGMRGLMAKPLKRLTGGHGETIETPIISSLKEGLSVIEYSISTHGSRKGLADTALKTADAGYLTRRLVDVCQDVVITMEDCGTVRGRNISALKEGEEIIEPLSDRVSGRFTAEDIFDPITDEVICEAGEPITAELAARIEECGLETVRIRSVLTCEASRGLCAKCYGWDLSRNARLNVGEAVGVIAAQSIGEPGTQLTLRTFHTGGVAGREAKEFEVHARHSGVVSFRNMHIVSGRDEEGNVSKIATRNAQIDLLDENGEVLSTYDIVAGSEIQVEDGQKVRKGAILCRSDPFIIPIVAEQSGSVHYVDIEEDITLQEEIDSEQRRQMVIVGDRSRTLHPHVFLLPEHMIALSGRPRRREEEIHAAEDYLRQAAEGEGRIIFTYRDVSSHRPDTLLEEIEQRSPEYEHPFVRVDCRKVSKGSYAAICDAVDSLIKKLGRRGGKKKKTLAEMNEKLRQAKSSKKNDALESSFAETLADFSESYPFFMCLSALERSHAGTRNVVKKVRNVIHDSRMCFVASFTYRGLRSHVVARGKRKQQAKDPVEEFIKDQIRGIYPIPSGAHLRVRDGSVIDSGVHIARIEKKLGQQRDITGGLPRVDELFEARRPKNAAAIAEISGVVALSPIKAGMRTVTIRGEQGQEASVRIPATRHIRVREGDSVEAGDKLTEGPLDPHDILRIKGTEAVEDYLLNEIQEVYRLQGVKINDKHIGIVVRQMLSKAKIEDPGDTRFLEGAQVDRLLLNSENETVMREGKRPATSDVLLLGITKASLATDSFLSAASFQETNKVLADAATAGKIDYLNGLKENVIVGHLIPAGTGTRDYRKVEIKMSDGSELPKPALPVGDVDETEFDA
ncbi:DNA-directed RNA polymerase subunit beta' [Candidatus Fermentibacteria bacterium]|nr:DNA-directed RNA polymerase subunit beta' [Candidatus Fermentibacteria bacterium]